MAFVLMFDVVMARVRLEAGLIAGHVVTYTHDFDRAARLARNTPTDVVIADWTRSRGPVLFSRLLQEADGPRPALVLTHDPIIRLDQLAHDRLANRAARVGVTHVVIRSGDKDLLARSLNRSANQALFVNWLTGNGPTRYPFTPDRTPLNRFTRWYADSPFTELVAFMGGWEVLRQAVDWPALRDSEGGLTVLVRIMSNLGKALQVTPERLLIDALLVSVQAKHWPNPLLSRSIGQIIKLIPLERCVCSN